MGGTLGRTSVWMSAVVSAAVTAAPCAAVEADARIGALIASLRAADPATRVWAAGELARLGPAAAPAVSALRRLVAQPPKRLMGKGAGWSPAEAAARALWAIRPRELTRVLEGDHRQASLNALAALDGRTEPEAVRGIQLALIDHCDEVRIAAARAMRRALAAGAVAPPAAVRRLGRATEDGNAQVRREAVAALGAVEGAGGQAALREASRCCSYRDTRIAAARQLARRAVRSVARDGRTGAAGRSRRNGDEPPMGLITNEALANATGLRPLSTVSVRRPSAEPLEVRGQVNGKGPLHPQWGPAGPAARPAQKRAPRVAATAERPVPAGRTNASPDMLAALRAAEALLAPSARGVGQLERIPDDQLIRQLRRGACHGQDPRTPGRTGQAPLDVLRQRVGQPTAAPLGKTAGAPLGSPADIKRLLRGLGLPGPPARTRQGVRGQANRR